jgi:hypothetical protein
MGQDDNFCASRNKRLQTGQNPPDPRIVTDPAILQWHIHIKTQQNAFFGQIHFIGKQKPVSHKTAPSVNMPHLCKLYIVVSARRLQPDPKSRIE